MAITVDPEFSRLLPKQTPDERAVLEADILESGCRDPLVTWQGILIDGHNRHEICTRHGLPFQTIEMDLPDRDAVEDWIAQNQLGRRNLTADWFKYLLGRRYNRAKKGNGQRGPEKLGQFDPAFQSTAAKLAKEHTVAEATVKRAGKFAAQVDCKPAWQKAMHENKPLKEVKKQEREAEIQEQREAIESGNAELPEGLYEVVCMDPPWAYGRAYDPETSRVANPYPEMAQAELLVMDPPFADDAVLFLWTTHQFMWDAKALMDHWGFAYKATMVWDKEKMGMGAWFRMQCEFCLMGIKGKPIWQNTTWRDVIREPRRQHSRKPEAFYRMVEECTVGRRLEMFSREQREGWGAHGNDTSKF